jgi:hypothetical protein
LGERPRSGRVARLEAELGRRDATAQLRIEVGTGRGLSSQVGQLGRRPRSSPVECASGGPVQELCHVSVRLDGGERQVARTLLEVLDDPGEASVRGTTLAG